MRWVVLVFVMLSVAGCLGDHGAGAGPQVAQSDVTVEAASNNTAPLVVLRADVDNLTAMFTVDVTDADGDNVTWTFFAGDGNETSGLGDAMFNHTYAEGGNVTAMLNATDGDAFVEATLQLTLEAAVVDVPPLPPGQTATGSFDAGGATLIGCFGDIVGVGYPAPLDGIFYASFAVEPHTVGYDYAATVTAPAQDSPGFAFLAADRSVVTSGFMSTHASGQVPEGAAIGVWWTCAGALVEGTYVSTPA